VFDEIRTQKKKKVNKDYQITVVSELREAFSYLVHTSEYLQRTAGKHDSCLRFDHFSFLFAVLSNFSPPNTLVLRFFLSSMIDK
jgi:hypothetical protein